MDGWSRATGYVGRKLPAESIVNEHQVTRTYALSRSFCALIVWYLHNTITITCILYNYSVGDLLDHHKQNVHMSLGVTSTAGVGLSVFIGLNVFIGLSAFIGLGIFLDLGAFHDLDVYLGLGIFLCLSSDFHDLGDVFNLGVFLDLSVSLGFNDFIDLGVFLDLLFTPVPQPTRKLGIEGLLTWKCDAIPGGEILKRYFYVSGKVGLSGQFGGA